MMIKWEDAQIEPLTPPSFKTHLNYISSLNSLSKDLELEFSLKIKKKIKKSKSLDKKINLIKLIKKSLDEEYRMAKNNKEFAMVCNTWISVKSYYLIFNLTIILYYLINPNNGSLNISHKSLLKNIKELVQSNKLTFSKNDLNKAYSCEEALNFKIESGENLKKGMSMDRAMHSLLKKLVNYKLISFKRDENIQNFKKKINQRKRNIFIKEETINLFEFFYWYRIKANYRDLEFLNQSISSDDFFKFYKEYFELTLTFYNAFKNVINKIGRIRIGEVLIR